MGFCRYHHREETLCESHILPKSFFRQVMSLDGGDALTLVEVGERHGKRRPKGDYDKSIMCSEADGAIGKFDEYGLKFFKPNIPYELLVDENNREFVRRADFDFKLMSLFLLSFLWRAHHSTIKPYEKLSIGPIFEAKIRDAIVNADGSLKPWFSYVIFWIYADHREVVFPIRYPSKTRISGRNFFIMYFLNFKVVARLDSTPVKELAPFEAKPDKNVIVLPAQEYSKSADFRNDLKWLEKSFRPQLVG